MNIQLSSFVPSGHTVTAEDGAIYGVPVAGSEVMLEFVWLEVQMTKRPTELIETMEKAQEEGWADDEEKVMEAIRENAARIDKATKRFKEIAVGLLREANPDLPADFKLTAPDAIQVIRAALGQEEEISAQQMAADTLNLPASTDAGDDADPPTKGKRGGAATMAPPRSRSATRSRKPSSP